MKTDRPNKPRGGRPPLKEGKRNHYLGIRLSPNEFQLIKQAAMNGHDQADSQDDPTKATISEYSRKQLLASTNLSQLHNKIIDLIETYRKSPPDFRVEEELSSLLDILEGKPNL